MAIGSSVAGRRLYQVCACDRLCMGAQGETWHGRDETACWEGDVQRGETCALHFTLHRHHLREGGVSTAPHRAHPPTPSTARPGRLVRGHMPAPPCWDLGPDVVCAVRSGWPPHGNFMQSDGASVLRWKVYSPIIVAFAARSLPIHSTDALISLHCLSLSITASLAASVYCEAATISILVMIHHWAAVLYPSESFHHSPISIHPSAYILPITVDPTRSTGNCMHVTMQRWMDSRVVVRRLAWRTPRKSYRIFSKSKPHRHGAVTFPVKELTSSFQSLIIRQ
jgi:hypothetical protein